METGAWYFTQKRMTRLAVVIIEACQWYQLHTKFYPTSFYQVQLHIKTKFPETIV
jgi:hypothetical protein